MRIYVLLQASLRHTNHDLASCFATSNCAPRKKKSLGNCRKTIAEWEDENNAIWPTLNGVVVPKASDGEFFPHLTEDGFENIDDVHEEEEEADRAYLRNGLRSKYNSEGSGVSRDAEFVYRKHPLVEHWGQVPLPRVVLVCREAHEAITKFPNPFGCPLSSAEAHFNFDSDTLFLHFSRYSPTRRRESVTTLSLDLRGEFSIKDTKCFQRGKKVAVYLNRLSKRISYPEWIAELLRIFPAVEELTLILQIPEDVSSLVFADPHPALPCRYLELQERLNRYDPVAELDRSRIRMPRPIARPVNTPLPNIDIQELKPLQREDQHTGISWRIPRIRFKDIVARDIKKLKEAKESCRQRIAKELKRRDAEAEENYSGRSCLLC